MKRSELNAKIAAMDGLTLPGGCDHCDATQEMQAAHYGTGVHRILVVHEDSCPVHGIPDAFRRK